ncbi:MAG: AMP-binding protein [Acidobacteriales bacterium]|nr:AMP-binding protein [Terriglobales bacterium]
MQTFYSRFLQSVERFPGHIAVELQRSDPALGIVSHSYADLRRMAESVGRWMHDAGIAGGARCAILGANDPRWVAAYLGALSNGAVAVPLDTAFKADQVAKLLLDCGATLLFADQKNLEIADQALALVKGKLDCRLVLLDGERPGTPDIQQMFAAGVGGFQNVQTGPEDLAVILYTSGTTSDPKGVMLTQGNLDAEANAVFAFIQFDQNDAILGVLPLFHALAQMANLMLPYSVGARVVYLEQLNTTELLRGLRERGITLFCCVPQFFYLIHEKVMKQVAQRSGFEQFVFRFLFRLSTWGRKLGLNLGRIFFAKAHEALGKEMRYLVTGGSRFDPAIGRDLDNLGFDILQAYGLTECSGGATVTGLRERFVGSVGRGLPGVDVKILEAKEEGGRMIGEVALRGPILMKGYFNRPDATAEVLKDGWLLTGDLGYLDADGRLFITGRKKEVIVLSSGKNIYPEEIETQYLKSQWIKEICVMGLVSKPGEPFSERLHAVIVPDFERLKEKKILNAKEVIRFDVEDLSSQVPSTKRILSYEIWQAELPRTTTRKLKRFEIQKIVEQKHAGEEAEAFAGKRDITGPDRAWLDQPEVAQAMQVILAASKKKGEVHPKDNLELDLGLDSMERVELVVALEQQLGAKADEDKLSHVYTVKELVEAVREGIGASGARARAGWDEIFAVESDDPEVHAILDPRPISTRLWFIFGIFVKLTFKTFFRGRMTGVDKLPKSGPFILCPNHQSFLDGPVVTAQLPAQIHKDLFYVGTSEIFGAGIGRSLARSLKLIPVDPDTNLVPAMRAGSFGLKNGKILVLYPEGERSIDGVPKMFKKGAAILAVHHNVPVVPVAIEGFHEAWPRGQSFRRFHPLQIAFGDPIYPPKDAKSPEEAYERLTTELKARVMELWQPLHDKNPAVIRAKAQLVTHN